SVSSLNSLHISTGGNYDFEHPIGGFDAIGYSWDDDYKIGDNLYEGLLLSFDLEITPDWLGYSLDGQANKTILGNTTIPMPVDGPHTIQVFGNETGTGTMYKSDIRNFVVSIFNIITPENKVYSGPMSGYYPATYGFENDEIGSDPEEFSTSETGGSIEVIEVLGGHRNIVDLYDTSVIDNVYFENSLSQLQENGSIEFWIRTNDTNKITTFALHGTGGIDPYLNILQLSIQDGFWKHRPSDTDYIIPNVAQPQNDTWHRVTIHFRCANAPAYMGLPSSSKASWKVIIDGVDSEKLDARAIYRTQVDYVIWNSYDSHTDYHTYVDAIGYSWDTYYNLGDNLKEGLLLSFNSEMELDWIAYSLDDQDYVPIVGNTTIPMPAVGDHTIQVFGDVYTSQVRHFTIRTPPPPPPPPGDDDDDDEGKEEIEFLGPTLIIIGISLAIGVTAIAIYLIRKRKLVRE
ncbi:MAG: hypothetical protein ACFFAH_02170, partial [Promethearchaeota archaeon]